MPQPGGEQTIRRIRTGEAERYRGIRLEALQKSPEAFATKYADALARDAESWREQADRNAASEDCALFFALLADKPVGLAGIYRDPEQPLQGELCQVWVAPAYRGDGTASRLMDTLLAWAGEHGFLRVVATIRASNARALGFYRKYGFVDADGIAGPLPGDMVLHRDLDN